MYLIKLAIVLFVFEMARIEATPTTDRDYLVPYLNKKYKLATSDDKFEDVMKALGVSFLKRKLAHLAKPVIELTEHDGLYTLSSESLFKNTYTTFRLGELFEEETPDDRVVMSTVTQDKNKLIHIQKGDKVTTVTREFTADEVKVTVEVDGIVSVRTYTPL
ncbi:regulation of retrograde trans-synaptic signaling by endocanabinoid [Homalodisca vitripennis]|nr:regulation of retrograde trans-synaptic signaling by endocanabinoid [Homalodisca vitripennis]